MLSRILDPRDGKPRDPVFWLVLGAVALSQLLAIWLLCTHEVRKAEARRAQSQVQRAAQSDCLRYFSQPTTAACSTQLAHREASTPGVPALR